MTTLSLNDDDGPLPYFMKCSPCVATGKDRPTAVVAISLPASPSRIMTFLISPAFWTILSGETDHCALTWAGPARRSAVDTAEHVGCMDGMEQHSTHTLYHISKWA